MDNISVNTIVGKNVVTNIDKVTQNKELLEKANSIALKIGSEAAKVACDLVLWYLKQERIGEAEMVLKYLTKWAEAKSSANFVHSSESLIQLALISAAHNKFFEAEKFLQEALLQFPEKDASANRSSVMFSLAQLYTQQNKCSDAEAMLKQVLRARVKTYGVKHPTIAAGLESYAKLLKQADKHILSGKMEMRAKEIRSDLLAASGSII